MYIPRSEFEGSGLGVEAFAASRSGSRRRGAKEMGEKSAEEDQEEGGWKLVHVFVGKHALTEDDNLQVPLLNAILLLTAPPAR